jgi:hypothetical protein
MDISKWAWDLEESALKIKSHLEYLQYSFDAESLRDTCTAGLSMRTIRNTQKRVDRCSETIDDFLASLENTQPGPYYISVVNGSKYWLLSGPYDHSTPMSWRSQRRHAR